MTGGIKLFKTKRSANALEADLNRIFFIAANITIFSIIIDI